MKYCLGFCSVADKCTVPLKILCCVTFHECIVSKALKKEKKRGILGMTSTITFFSYVYMHMCMHQTVPYCLNDARP